MANVSVGSSDVIIIGGLLLLVAAGGFGLALGGRKIVKDFTAGVIDVGGDAIQGGEEIVRRGYSTSRSFTQGLVRGNEYVVNSEFTTRVLPELKAEGIDTSTFINRPLGVPLVTAVPRRSGERYVAGTTYEQNGRAKYEIRTAPTVPGRGQGFGARVNEAAKDLPGLGGIFRHGGTALDQARDLFGRLR